jgi:hypothetical protein
MNRPPLHRALPLLLALTIAAVARAGDPGVYTVVEEHWYELLIDDAKIGWMSVTVEDDGTRFRTVTESRVRMDRAGERVEIRTGSRFTEQHDGTPIRCSSTQDMSLQETRMEFVFEDDGVTQTAVQGGTRTTRTVPRPDGVWFAPAAADRFARSRRAAGAEELTYRLLDPENGMEPIAVRSVRAGAGEHDVDGRMIPVTIWTTTTDMMPMATTEAYSSDGHLVHQELRSGLGLMVTRIADRPIRNVHRARRATLRLKVKEGVMPELPSAASQRFEAGADAAAATLHVDLDAALAADAEERADAAYLAASAMVNTDDPLVRKLADRATRNTDEDAMERSAALRNLVHRHISRKGFDTAFASAAETARTRRGDCSEHAVLLCALLRAEAIPARVASGLVYVDEFAGASDVFGWHMWTQALIDGCWVDLDATLFSRYHAGHVLVGTSSLADSGAAGDMASMLALIGNLEIEVVDVGYGERDQATTQPSDKAP